LNSSKLLVLSNKQMMPMKGPHFNIKLIASLQENFVEERKQAVVERWEQVMQRMLTKHRQNQKLRFAAFDAIDSRAHLKHSKVHRSNCVTFVNNFG